MTQNDKRNTKISEICRILANACSSENTSLYPQDIMTFVNESKNSDVRELLALHMALNEIDAIKRLDKNLECVEAWRHYTRSLRRTRRQVVRSPDWYSVEQINDDFEKGFTYLENADALVLEYEIEEHEKLLKSDKEILESFGVKTDNDIAYQTCKEIEDAKVKRLRQLSKIAYDAVKKHVYYGTVLRFMQTICKDDSERTSFLCDYAQAQWIDGHFNH